MNLLHMFELPRRPCRLWGGWCGVLLMASMAGAFESAEEAPIAPIDREHWAFVPITRPEVPEVRDDSWCRSPVDHFILSRLERKGLRPLPEADRTTLLRRLTFDLTGLPPSPDELDRFISDPSPDAYERLVDRLLDSPAYGERWARHWLDLVRFAETDGFEHDKVRPQAWRYRDWVIEALNRDLPYDQFLRQQLAGDLIDPENPGTAIATGYLLAGPDMPDINLVEERRHMLLNDMTANVGELFLGLQFGCVQCHDHKADPISIQDFYRLRAFFDPLDIFEDHPLPGTNDKGRIVRQESQPVGSFVRIRGDFRRPGERVEPAVLRVAVPEGKPPTVTTRVDLARWMTSPENPLVSRVMVNRIWQQHFGVGLCSSSSDFGQMGDFPTHPELLDWLAKKFQDDGWSLKKLHRVLVCSATYRTMSRPVGNDDETWNRLLAQDPENRWLGRMRRRRLDAEEIRDAMLTVSGQLNPESGGPGIRPPLPKEVVQTLLKDQWPVTEDASQHTRRSVYLFMRRNVRFPLLEVFDQPDPNLSCARRMQTTIAPQALHLLNSEFAQDCARGLAHRVRQYGSSTQSPDRQIRDLYRLVFGRSAEPDEVRSAGEFLRAGTETDWTDLCLALLNLNEFVYAD